MKSTVIAISFIQLVLVVLASEESESEMIQQPEERSEMFPQSEEANYSTSFENQHSESDTEKSGYVSHMQHFVDQSQFNSGVSSNNGYVASDNAQQASANVPIVSGQGYVQTGSSQQVGSNQGHGTHILTGLGQHSSGFGHGGSALGQVAYGGSGFVQGSNIVSGVSHGQLGSGYGGSNNVHVPQIVSGLGPISSGNVYGGSNQGAHVVSGLGQIVTGQGISGQIHETGIVSGQTQLASSSVASKPGHGSIGVHAPVTEVIHQEHHIVYEVPKPSPTVAVKPTEVAVEQNNADSDNNLSLFGIIKPFFAMFTLIKIAMKIVLIAFIFFMFKSFIGTLPVMLVGALGVVSLCTFTPLCHLKFHGYGNTHHLRSLATPERLYTASKFLKSAIEKYKNMKSIAVNEVRKRR